LENHVALQPVPDIPPRQLPLFESLRPNRFEITVAGTTELDILNEGEADLAEALRLGNNFLVTILCEGAETDDVGQTFFASVTKRVHKRVKDGAIVSVATLTIAPEA
jgi:hypothetical protein